MKLRIRHQRNTQVIQLRDDNEQRANFGALKLAVANLYGISDSGEPYDFQLSLNGSDAVSSDNCTPLSELGIVSGDLIIVLTPSLDLPAGSGQSQGHHAADSAQAQMPRKSSSSPLDVSSKSLDEDKGTTMETNTPNVPINSTPDPSSSEFETPRPGSSSEPVNEAVAMETMAAAIAADKDAIQDSEVNKYLQVPMMVRDSSSGAIALTVIEAYEGTEGVSDHHQALCVLLHVLMSESGFTAQNTVEAAVENRAMMPESWHGKGMHKLNYQHPQAEDAQCTVAYVPMQNRAVIHGSVKVRGDSQRWHLSVKCSKYITDDLSCATTAYKGASLPALSCAFKDTVAYPMLQYATAGECGASSPPCLVNLVLEIKLLILQNLDAASLLRMSETCKEFSEVTKLPYLWRGLFLRKFGRRPNNDLSQDWLQLYKTKYQERKHMREWIYQRTPVVPPFFGIPPPGGVFPGSPAYPPDFIIGGDYDRDPNFGGVPGPFAGPGVHIPRPGLPRPRYDPLGPQRFRPGRGGGMWDPGSRGRFGGSGGFGPRMF